MAKYASLDSLRAIRDWAKEKFQSKLPAVTAQDNGDVLSVVDGEWAKATPQDELPEVSASDNGKFLGVVNGAWGKADVDALPAVTSQDNGKVLGVVEGQWAKTEPEDGLPSVTSSDNGKVLSVVEGEWAPAEPTGGLPEVTSEDNGDLLSVVDGAWAKSEPGYRVSEVAGTEIVPEQSVTAEVLNTQALADIGPITWFPEVYPEAIIVVIDGTQYALEKSSDESGVVSYDGAEGVAVQYVAMDAYFSVTMPASMAGTRTISISEPGTHDVVPSEDFKLAVNNSYMEATEVDVVPEQTVEATDQDGVFEAELTNTALPFPPPETLSVTLNGTVYDLPSTSVGGSEYGAPWGDEALDFTTYPLNIHFDGGICFIYTPDAGPYTVHSTLATIKPSKNFVSAVEDAYFQVVDGEKEFISNQTVTTTAVSGRSYSSGNISKGDETPTEGLPPTLTVTFDGVEYELPKVPFLQGYGALSDDGYDFTNYPLFINEVFTGTGYQWVIYTPQAGTYTLSATYTEAVTAPTEKFKEAVKQSGCGMQTVMFEVYYDDSGETTPEHIIVTCDKTIDELIATEGPLDAKAVLWQTNPAANAIAAAAYDNYGSAYAEFQFLQLFTESPHELMYTTIMWDSGLEKWTVGFYAYGLTPLT